MKELETNNLFPTSKFVDFLNSLGVKSEVTKKGFKYDFNGFKEYVKKTPKGIMPIWLTQYGEANLKWLLSGE